MSIIVPGICAASSAIALTAGVRQVAASRRRSGISFRIVGRTRSGAQLARSLERAGVPLSADAFCGLTFAGAVAVALATFALIHSPVIAVVATTASVAGAIGVVRSADRRYLDRLGGQLATVAQQLGGAVGAGLSLRQAVARVAADAPKPASSELTRLARELDLGIPLDDALEAMAQRLPAAGLRTMVTAIQVQRIAGGNLSGALADLSYRLDDRAALEREGRSATAQARMSAWLVSALPLVGGVMAEIASPGTLARTLGQGIGLIILIVASLLQLVGVLVIRRLMRGAAL